MIVWMNKQFGAWAPLVAGISMMLCAFSVVFVSNKFIRYAKQRKSKKLFITALTIYAVFITTVAVVSLETSYFSIRDFFDLQQKGATDSNTNDEELTERAYWKTLLTFCEWVLLMQCIATFYIQLDDHLTQTEHNKAIDERIKALGPPRTVHRENWIIIHCKGGLRIEIIICVKYALRLCENTAFLRYRMLFKRLFHSRFVSSSPRDKKNTTTAKILDFIKTIAHIFAKDVEFAKIVFFYDTDKTLELQRDEIETALSETVRYKHNSIRSQFSAVK